VFNANFVVQADVHRLGARILERGVSVICFVLFSDIMFFLASLDT
jgi:hypothetical protein